MEIINTTLEKARDIIIEHLETQEEAFLYGFTLEKGVHTGADEDFNEEYCKENNIPVWRLIREGGTIVTSIDDICVGLLIKDLNCPYPENLINRIVDLLLSKNLNAETQGNDILVEGKYKVLGFGSRVYGKLLFIGIQISINCDLELIKNVCKKTMRKIPKGMGEYGVTKEEVLAIVLEEFNKLGV